MKHTSKASPQSPNHLTCLLSIWLFHKSRESWKTFNSIKKHDEPRMFWIFCPGLCPVVCLSLHHGYCLFGSRPIAMFHATIVWYYDWTITATYYYCLITRENNAHVTKTTTTCLLSAFSTNVDLETQAF